MKILGTEVSPWALGGGILAVTGIAIAVSRSKEPAKAPEEKSKVKKTSPLLQSGRSRVPGERCSTGKEGVFANYDEDGACQVFWDDSYRDAVVGHAIQIYDEMDDSGFCDNFYVTLYPGTAQEVVQLKPNAVDLIRAALSRTYGSPGSSWFPRGSEGYEKGSYAMQASWDLARWAVLKELCGYEPVT